MLDFLQQYSGAFTLLATVALVAITAFYVYLTKGILAATANQSRLSLAPVVGIKITGISISKVFGPRRRNMSIAVELSNVGNAPAIEVLVDAEIDLRYSRIGEESSIPARHEPDMIPFIRPGELVTESSPNFGNKLITHFFDDARESLRLNLHRIETDPTQESFKTSRLRVFVYYRNSLGQHFKSLYETEIALWAPLGEEKIPGDDETCEVNQIYIPRPVFHAGVADENLINHEIASRNEKRSLCGW